ncbi:hypothetical protein [Natrononativus amylolyticus]|uniref:hypothetical protein n=1 Tax=Natrononativus amylolyticus TaxID=2963434 RepID=UPI0020CE602E|nr:hypothetical protein [Natrononativus amylolyticus]
MAFTALASSWLSLVAILVLLVGVPLFVVLVLAVVSGYIRHDAERLLEAEAEDDVDDER